MTAASRLRFLLLATAAGLPGAPALAAMQPGLWELTMTVTVDGKRAPLSAIALGKDGTAPADDVVDITAASVTSNAEPACAPPDAGVRVCLWRFPGEQVAAMPEIKDPAVREKLRALGYLQ